MANMIIKPAVGGNLLIQDRAGGAVLSTSTSGATIASGVTGGAGLSGMTSLGTVTSGTISTGATIATGVHGKYFLKECDDFHYNSSTNMVNNTSQAAANISGSNSCEITTGSSTGDLVEFFVSMGTERGNNYIGHGIERDSNSSFNSGSKATVYATGTHACGSGSNNGDEYERYNCSIVASVSDWGLSASTQYFFRAIGQTHTVSGTMYFGSSTGISGTVVGGGGVRMAVRLWTLIP